MLIGFVRRFPVSEAMDLGSRSNGHDALQYANASNTCDIERGGA
jgi:hypothetical protein